MKLQSQQLSLPPRPAAAGEGEGGRPGGGGGAAPQPSNVRLVRLGQPTVVPRSSSPLPLDRGPGPPGGCVGANAAVGSGVFQVLKIAGTESVAVSDVGRLGELPRQQEGAAAAAAQASAPGPALSPYHAAAPNPAAPPDSNAQPGPPQQLARQLGVPSLLPHHGQAQAQVRTMQWLVCVWGEHWYGRS